jgi:hypothetical protein
MAQNALRSIGRRVSQRSKDKGSKSTISSTPELFRDDYDSENTFNLFLLHPKPDHVVYESGDPPPGSSLRSRALGQQDVDIIAIHGLGGNPRKTWTHQNGKMWLEDFAPTAFPRFRIYTFGYDSEVAFSKGTGTLRDFAKNFLVLLGMERVSSEVCCHFS